MVSPKIKNKFEKELNSLNVKFSLELDDVSRYIHNQIDLNNAKTKRSIGFDYNKYHDLDKINKWMDNFALKHTNTVKIFEVSKSFEGRSIRALQISTAFNESKPAIWIDGFEIIFLL